MALFWSPKSSTFQDLLYRGNSTNGCLAVDRADRALCQWQVRYMFTHKSFLWLYVGAWKILKQLQTKEDRKEDDGSLRRPVISCFVAWVTAQREIPKTDFRLPPVRRCESHGKMSTRSLEPGMRRLSQDSSCGSTSGDTSRTAPFGSLCERKVQD